MSEISSSNSNSSVSEKYDYFTSCGDMITHIAMFMPRAFYIYRMMQVSKVWYAAATDKLLWWNVFGRRWPRSILKEFSSSMPTNFEPRSAWLLLKSKYCFQEYATSRRGNPITCEAKKLGLRETCLSTLFLTDREHCTLSNCFQFRLCWAHGGHTSMAFMPTFLHVGIMPNLAGGYFRLMVDHYCEKFYGPDYMAIIDKRFADEVFDKAVLKFTKETREPRVSDLSSLRTCFDELKLPCSYKSIVFCDGPVCFSVERAIKAFLVVEEKQVRRRDLEMDLGKYDDIGLVSWTFSKSDVVPFYITNGTLPITNETMPKLLSRSHLPGTLYLKYYRDVLRKNRMGIYDLIEFLPSIKSEKRKLEKFVEGSGYRNYDLTQFVNMLKEDIFFKENHEEIVVDMSTSTQNIRKVVSMNLFGRASS